MGQTLTNGIYLPAEGERNCYTGLAANWTALDSLIGGYNAHIGNATIHVTAEDKQAWNGKADASALTAHTGDTTIHVTAADKEAWNGKADDADVVHKSGNETKSGELTLSDTLNSSDVVPIANNSYSSGSSNNQWNNIYSKNYYYNGVAWGLDKANEWTGSNVYSSSSLPTLKLKNTSLDISSLPASNFGIHIDYLDKNNVAVGGWNYIKGPSGITRLYCELTTKNSNNQDIRRSIRLDTNQEGNVWTYYPSSNGEIDLGTSTNKWKTFNGLEPSSLSLPSCNASDIIDISSYITDFSGPANTYTASANGWVTISVNNCMGIQAYILGLFGDSRTRQTAGTIKFLMPICKNQTINLQVYGGTLEHARFIPCQGNV